MTRTDTWMLLTLFLVIVFQFGVDTANVGFSVKVDSAEKKGKTALLEQVSVGDIMPTEKKQQLESGNSEEGAADVPDFASIQNVARKKEVFFRFMLLMVVSENGRLLSRRTRIVRLSRQPELSEGDRSWLQKVAVQYRVAVDWTENKAFFQTLLSSVDMIPPSLVLAQSANESAWGTSRFAVEGNNYFGQWCFTAGCGLVPRERTPGSTHEVRRFATPLDSVRSYMHNLNSGQSYRKLRALRSKARANNEVITGIELAQGLDGYSSMGEAYVAEIQSMIRSNRLGDYDLVCRKSQPLYSAGGSPR